jgi:hypothetical protein
MEITAGAAILRYLPTWRPLYTYHRRRCHLPQSGVVTRFKRMKGNMMERRQPSTYSTDELLRMAAAHRIRLTQRVNILKRELHQRASELAAIEACLDEVMETEHRLMREQQPRQ